MRNFLFLFILLNPFFSVAQNANKTVVPDERLYEVYDRDYVDGLVNENPFLIKRWNFYLDNAYMITDEVAEKNNGYPVVTISDLHNINILLLEKEQQLQRDWDKPMIYKIRDTGKILVFHAGKDFTKSLKEHLAEQ